LNQSYIIAFNPLTHERAIRPTDFRPRYLVNYFSRRARQKQVPAQTTILSDGYSNDDNRSSGLRSLQRLGNNQKFPLKYEESTVNKSLSNRVRSLEPMVFRNRASQSVENGRDLDEMRNAIPNPLYDLISIELVFPSPQSIVRSVKPFCMLSSADKFSCYLSWPLGRNVFYLPLD
jgi:hypothetical protein